MHIQESCLFYYKNDRNKSLLRMYKLEKETHSDKNHEVGGKLWVINSLALSIIHSKDMNHFNIDINNSETGNYINS